MTRGNRKTTKQRKTNVHSLPRPMGATQRRRSDPLVIMRNDEALLCGNADPEMLKRRCDLALWNALFDQALIQVARHEFIRGDMLSLAAEVWRVRDDWDDTARDCSRVIRVTSPQPWRFELRLPWGVYSDDVRIVYFTLGEGGTILVRYKGWEDGEGGAPPSAPFIPSPVRPSDATGIAERAIRRVLGHLSAHQGYIPTKADLDDLLRREAQEASKRRFGDWPSPRKKSA